LKTTRITDRITYVQPDSMANFSSCSGVMIESRKKVWIDMNLGPEDTPKLLKQEQPDTCIITHYHLDHSVWTRHVKAYSDASVWVPGIEEKCLTSLDYVIEHTAGVLGKGALWQDFVVNTLGYRELTEYYCYDTTTSFRDDIPEMVLIDTPGHSPGHTSFYFPDEKLLVSGDMGLDRFGPWYGWADCSILDFVHSILQLDGLEIKTVLTSHGGVVNNNIHDRLKACLRQLVTREQTVDRQLEQGRTKAQIVSSGLFFNNKDAVKDPMRSFLYMWETSMVGHHETLLRKGGLKQFFPELFTPGFL
jgi:hydroxyacylglutathione hydrolase